MKAEKSEKEVTKKSGSIQGSTSDQTAFSPPPSLYPDLHSVRPPPYVPNQDLQQVQVTEKESAVEVEMAELDMMKEQIKLLTAWLDGATGLDPHERPGSQHSEQEAEYGEDDKQSVHSEGPCASVHSQQGLEEVRHDGATHQNVLIKGTITSFPIAARTRSHVEGQFTPKGGETGIFLTPTEMCIKKGIVRAM